MQIDRRLFLLCASALAVIGPNAVAVAAADAFASSPWRKLTPAQWKARLPAPAFGVLRNEDTEAPNSSPLNNEHRRGTFACLGCGLALFKSDWKFNSGTGWPSFYTALPGAVGTKSDFKLVLEERTEYHCARCLGHQGHIFHDGPKPTGLRYCNNGVALTFAPV